VATNGAGPVEHCRDAAVADEAPGTPSIEIGILEKRPPALDVRLPPMLLLHGATFGARLFDCPGRAIR
jgi:hypothetical protein